MRDVDYDWAQSERDVALGTATPINLLLLSAVADSMFDNIIMCCSYMLFLISSHYFILFG